MNLHQKHCMAIFNSSLHIQKVKTMLTLLTIQSCTL